MFEVSISYHDSASPRRRRVDNFNELSLLLEKVPNQLGFLSNRKATIEIEAVSTGGQTLFDIPETI